MRYFLGQPPGGQRFQLLSSGWWAGTAHIHTYILLYKENCHV